MAQKLYTEEQVRKAALFSLAEDATMENIPHIEDFTPFKECILIPLDVIENTPNDMELGDAIRKLYWKYKK